MTRLSQIKIVFIITGLNQGGAEAMLYKLLSSIDKEKFAPVVITLLDGGIYKSKIENLGVPVYSSCMKRGRFSIIGFCLLVKLLRNLKPDLLQGWMYHGNLIAQLSSVFLKKKISVLWNIRGTHTNLSEEKFTSAVTMWLGARLSSLPVYIINNSQASALSHEQKLNYRTGKWIIIPNGFDTSLFVPSDENRLKFRSDLGLPKDAFLIGLVARYHPMKDHTNFLYAAVDILKTHPNIHFILVGTDVEPSNTELMEKINTFGLGKSFHVLGNRDDIPYLTSALDIASSSSYGEGFPNVVGEAMSCGVSCVVTKVGDADWIVGDTGIVVPPRDPVSLANGWRKLIELGQDKRLALGMMARQRIIKKFSLDDVVKKYEMLYKEIIGRN
ncbi:MAG: hypothetical protein A2W17_09145 [Planctomycetes bacterium RBG_16_41_13]|nr:MAG: hypothetical protein A2W17_09145 [Planctomycetes bacterium RBG_16_41_13]